MIKLPTLYHKNVKGKIISWETWAQDSFVYTRWGQLKGKQQESKFEVEAKNEGRSNATTKEEQAILESKSLWTNKLERKYYQTIKEAEEQIVFLPMLAKSFADRKRFITEEEYEHSVTVQPKLDGLRCMVSWDEETNEIKLTSRNGKQYILSHLIDELEPDLPGNIVLDGELYIHDTSLQQLNSLVRPTKNFKDESIEVEYHVYDIIDQNDLNLTWRKRLILLDEFFTCNNFKKIKKVPTMRAYSEEEVIECQNEYVKQGYEGAIVRLRDGKYKFGYRSSDLLKVKSFQDEEFEIVNYTNGIGKFETCIIYTCKTKDGKEFNVVPKGTVEQRVQWLKDGQQHIGKMLKVEFFDWTPDGIPQFPIGICIRLEEDI